MVKKKKDNKTDISMSGSFYLIFLKINNLIIIKETIFFSRGEHGSVRFGFGPNYEPNQSYRFTKKKNC